MYPPAIDIDTTINVPNNNNDLLSACPLHPIITNTSVAITKDAIVIPDTGKFDVPIVPVKRPATIINSAAKTIETIAPTIAITMLPEIKNAPITATTIPPNNIIV